MVGGTLHALKEQERRLLSWLRKVIEDPRTDRVIMALIVFNAITLGIETSDRAMTQYGTLLNLSTGW
jgi:hypothetical protein